MQRYNGKTHLSTLEMNDEGFAKLRVSMRDINYHAKCNSTIDPVSGKHRNALKLIELW